VGENRQDGRRQSTMWLIGFRDLNVDDDEAGVLLEVHVTGGVVVPITGAQSPPFGGPS
jgi:hypothetical protein